MHKSRMTAFRALVWSSGAHALIILNSNISPFIFRVYNRMKNTINFCPFYTEKIIVSKHILF